MRKVIISLAPVQAGTSVDAVKLAEDVEKSVKLGAAMCHLHCRKPDGSLTPDISYIPDRQLSPSLFPERFSHGRKHPGFPAVSPHREGTGAHAARECQEDRLQRPSSG